MDDNREKSLWVYCPICGGKTRTKVYDDTVLIKFPLYCPKYKHETLINAKQQEVTIVKKMDV